MWMHLLLLSLPTVVAKISTLLRMRHLDVKALHFRYWMTTIFQLAMSEMLFLTMVGYCRFTLTQLCILFPGDNLVAAILYAKQTYDLSLCFWGLLEFMSWTHVMGEQYEP